MSEFDAVEHVLNRDDWPEGVTSQHVATEAIKALDAVRSSTWRPLGSPLKVNDTFKSHYFSKTQVVGWIGREVQGEGPELVWFISDGTEHGLITHLFSPFWRWSAPARMSDKVLERLTTNKLGLKVGNKIRLTAIGSRMIDPNHEYKVLATAEKCVLVMERQTRGIWALDNSVLERFYVWEGKE